MPPLHSLLRGHRPPTFQAVLALPCDAQNLLIYAVLAVFSCAATHTAVAAYAFTHHSTYIVSTLVIVVVVVLL